eukprot:3346061-Prymnesium_polylepis.1
MDEYDRSIRVRRLIVRVSSCPSHRKRRLIGSAAEEEEAAAEGYFIDKVLLVMSQCVSHTETLLRALNGGRVHERQCVAYWGRCWRGRPDGGQQWLTGTGRLTAVLHLACPAPEIKGPAKGQIKGQIKGQMEDSKGRGASPRPANPPAWSPRWSGCTCRRTTRGRVDLASLSEPSSMEPRGERRVRARENHSRAKWDPRHRARCVRSPLARGWPARPSLPGPCAPYSMRLGEYTPGIVLADAEIPLNPCPSLDLRFSARRRAGLTCTARRSDTRRSRCRSCAARSTP